MILKAYKKYLFYSTLLFQYTLTFAIYTCCSTTPLQHTQFELNAFFHTLSTKVAWTYVITKN